MMRPQFAAVPQLDADEQAGTADFRDQWMSRL